jgi:hypothetical protein
VEPTPTPTEVAAVTPTPTEPTPTPTEVAPPVMVEPPRMTEIARVDPPTMTEPTTMIVRVDREPTETMTSEMAAAAPRGRGTLVVNSLPWSEVYVDGRRRGNTPIPSLQLPAGEHRIELRTADGRTHRETITIEPNATARVVHRF